MMLVREYCKSLFAATVDWKRFSWEFLNRLNEWCSYVVMWYSRAMAMKDFQVRWHSSLYSRCNRDCLDARNSLRLCEG